MTRTARSVAAMNGSSSYGTHDDGRFEPWLLRAAAGMAWLDRH